jgi:phosphoglycolate phosphatase-like HAD superfamily hydrolase
MRILLWDIDGTLIRSAKVDGYKVYTIPVLEEIFGTAGRLADMQVSGMTDLQIVFEALSETDISKDEILARAEVLVSHLTHEARRVTGNGEKFFKVLPGVRETGNIKPMAQLKMELVGLDHFFTMPGAFGDESHNRRDLPARAAERIRKHLQMDLAPEQFIVIGDTPNDIDCARHFGARAVAVGTGRMFSRAEILECKPDALLPDLADTDLVLETLNQF